MKMKENQRSLSVVRELKKIELGLVSGGENMQGTGVDSQQR